jgi:glyoxylase-like metal-dependent hydrolase (beta-lactamase superfamily II)
MELGPNLFRIGNDLVAVHLVATPDGLTLIDAGMPGQYGDLQAELRRIGRRPGDIRGLVLTHGDSDHIGFAERLRSELGIPVYVHAADAARARGEDKPRQSWGKVRIGPTASFLTYGLRKGALRTPPLGEVSTFEDAAVLDLPGQPRVIAMPGHSPGSVALHVPAVRAVFVGDALTTRNVLTGAGGPGPAPFTDAPETAAESLARLADLDVDWVIPGHGPAWHGGVPALMDAYRAAAGVRP